MRRFKLVSAFTLIIFLSLLLLPGSLFADPTGTLSVSPTTVAVGYEVTYTMTFTNYTDGGPYYFQLSTGTNSREYGLINVATKVRHDFFTAPGQYTAELLVYTTDGTGHFYNPSSDTLIADACDTVLITVTENTDFGFETITPGSSTYIKIYNNIVYVSQYILKIYNYCGFSSLQEFLALESDDREDYLVFDDDYQTSSPPAFTIEEYNIDLDDGVYVATLEVDGDMWYFWTASKNESFIVGSGCNAGSSPGENQTNQNSGQNTIVNKPRVYEKTSGGFITYYYNKLLFREPEDIGFNAWLERLEDGIITGKEMIFDFIFGLECQDRIKDYSDQQFMTFLYNQILNREPDDFGYEAWLSKLSEGISRQDILREFLKSEEFKNICIDFGINP